MANVTSLRSTPSLKTKHNGISTENGKSTKKDEEMELQEINTMSRQAPPCQGQIPPGYPTCPLLGAAHVEAGKNKNISAMPNPAMVEVKGSESESNGDTKLLP